MSYTQWRGAVGELLILFAVKTGNFCCSLFCKNDNTRANILVPHQQSQELGFFFRKFGRGVIPCFNLKVKLITKQRSLFFIVFCHRICCKIHETLIKPYFVKKTDFCVIG